jgi:hypothetical protein
MPERDLERGLIDHLRDLILELGKVSVPGCDDGEGLKLEVPLAQSDFSPPQSATWLKIAVSIAPTAAMRSSLTLWL